MRKAIVLFSLLVSMSSFAQTEVHHYNPGLNSEGVTYFLPRTCIDITIKAQKTTYQPGEFCRYAEKYLRQSNVSTEPSEQWNIQSVAIKPIGVPDQGKVFTIKLKDKTVAPLVELTEDGIIKSINTRYPEQAIPKKEEEKAGKVLNPRNYLTEEMLLAGSTAKMAELVAQEIYHIRESKNAITRGQADNMPKDGEMLRIMLNSLDEQEQALMQLFVGTTTKKSETFTVRIDPTENIDKKVLLRFSKKLGLVSASDLSGAPVYLTITSQNLIPRPTSEEQAKKKLEGVVYNIPGKADITITYGTQKLYSGELLLSQFGNSEVLTNTLFNKKTTTKVTFDPTTGGLIKIEAEHE